MHHVAFEVADVSAAVDRLAADGVEVIDPEPRPGLGGREVSFVHPDSLHGVLAEVISG
jgi:methylmalonyl-CoA/ethylmalonyl-CoA epimerase